MSADWAATKARASMRGLLAAHGWQLFESDPGDDYWMTPVETWGRPGQRFRVQILCQRHNVSYGLGMHHLDGGTRSCVVPEEDIVALVTGGDDLDEAWSDLATRGAK